MLLPSSCIAFLMIVLGDARNLENNIDEQGSVYGLRSRGNLGHLFLGDNNEIFDDSLNGQQALSRDARNVGLDPDAGNDPVSDGPSEPTGKTGAIDGLGKLPIPMELPSLPGIPGPLSSLLPLALPSATDKPGITCSPCVAGKTGPSEPTGKTGAIDELGKLPIPKELPSLPPGISGPPLDLPLGLPSATDKPGITCSPCVAGKTGKPDESEPNAKPNGPGKPGPDQLGKPGGDQPGKPGGDQPGKPGGDQPGKPGPDKASKPDVDLPGEPGKAGPLGVIGTLDPSGTQGPPGKD